MAASGNGWLGPALRAQSLGATLLMAGFGLAAVAGVVPRSGGQVAVLLAGMVVVGVPHGAFDHLVARPRLQHLGRLWWVWFGLGYLGLAGLVWLAWAAAPASTLAVFLMGTVLHFGLGDMEDELAPAQVPRVVALLAYGGMPLLLPMALHPAQAAPVLAALAEVSASAMEAMLAGTAWLLPPWTALFAWTLVAAWRERRCVAERLATALGFVLLPPLLAFGLYFAAGHSIRHMLRLGAWHSPNDGVVATAWLARVIVPASLISGAGLSGLALWNPEVTEGILAPLFRMIAALTLPHMIVTYLLGQDARGERANAA